MARRGRTPALDELKQREICAILAVGGSRRTAAKYVGCAADTIRRTAERNPEFRDRLKRAESDLEVIHLSNIQAASKKYWRASAWVLERVYPERYAKRGPATITTDQISHLLAQFADILVEEVPEARHRKKIIDRLEHLTTGLEFIAD